MTLVACQLNEMLSRQKQSVPTLNINKATTCIIMKRFISFTKVCKNLFSCEHLCAKISLQQFLSTGPYSGATV